VARILVVDDDAHLREIVRYALVRDGHAVDEAADGHHALARVAAGGVELVVLDVLMPELDGLSVCRRLRAGGGPPIIFLSSRGEDSDRVIGLDLGGDDYLSKPFSPRELAARVRAVLRRHADGPGPGAPLAPPPPPLRHGRLTIDRARHLATVDDRELDLTATELRLLAALLEHPGRTLSRDQLIACAYPDRHHVAVRTVDTHVRNIRHKLAVHGVDPIATVNGVGYRGA
jgi:two-component system OmpR family response regulator